LKFNSNRTNINGGLFDVQYIFSMVARSVLLRMKNISDKIGREPRNTHFMFDALFFLNRAVYEMK
jgi:hypothetical protein